VSKDYPSKSDLEQAGVKYLAASFVDMHGVPKAKMVPIHHYDRMMEGSELFTGAALDGVPQEVSDEEVAAVPDPASVKILPWDPEVAWFASDLRCHGQPFEAGSRNILKRALQGLSLLPWRTHPHLCLFSIRQYHGHGLLMHLRHH